MAFSALGEGPQTLSLAFSLRSPVDWSGVVFAFGPAERALSVTRSRNRSMRSGSFATFAQFLSRGRAQAVDFLRREWPELSRRHVESEWTIFHALDFLHMMPDFLEHAANLAVSPLDQRDLVPGIGGFLYQMNLCRRGAHAPALVCAD